MSQMRNDTDVKCNLTNEVTAYFSSDIQQILGFLGKVAEELKKMKKEACDCCPAGWKLVGSKCYNFQKTLETWERSREECTKNYSVLLILDNKAELDSLRPFLEGERYWVGLQREAQNSSGWRWVDGTPLTFSVWNTNEPNNAKYIEDCAEIWNYSLSLNDYRCDIKKPFICKAPSKCC
ncbi:C-type lectin domain family 4 member E-like [Rana temporaria]|uniref:C-type lectin domain family 4 member E-like n=1 Tax=Rana temporaria TaxID=8407 RepID=UPI001AADCBC3|nr:C-type lectin domain family 4 member E-like [Rana temporaria]